MSDPLQLITGTFAELDRWKVRAASHVVPIEGSDLAGDDHDWRPMRVSEVARSGLAAAVDHLCALRATLQAGQLYPFAQLSLLRAGLIGAAQAVWVLYPDDASERIRRGRMAAQQWHDQHRIFVGAQLACPGADRSVGEPMLAYIRQRLDEISVKRDAAGDRQQLHVIDVVQDAVRAVFVEDVFVAEAVVEWRRMSGSAHGWSWAALGVEATTVASEPDEHGVAFFAATGGLSVIVNPYRLVYLLTKKGWALFDQRSGVT